MFLDMKKKRYDILKWMENQYKGLWTFKEGMKTFVPTEDDKTIRRLLVTVLCSFLGGHLSTAVQESTFSLAGAAEGGVRSSRGHSVNLSSRIFTIANSDWLEPIKGSRVRAANLKRRCIELGIMDSPVPKKTMKREMKLDCVRDVQDDVQALVG